MRWAWSAVVAGLSLLAACGSSEEPSGSGGKAGSDAGSAGSGGTSGSGGVGGISGAGGSSGAGPSCGSCGEERAGGTCQLAFTKCTTDPGGCKTIMDCVYGATPGCTLGAEGAPCVESCIQTHCTSTASAKLFLEAERCAFCEPACGGLCSAYCDAFTLTPDTVTCPNIVDAGPDADTDADTDATADAEVDGSTDAAADVSADSPAE